MDKSGGDFLAALAVTFDFSHQRFVSRDPDLQINHTAQEDMSGLSILAKGANLKTFEIVQVRSGTPGSDAGLKEGDVIVGLDEEPCRWTSAWRRSATSSARSATNTNC